MALSPKERGPRVSAVCIRCGKSARLKRIEVSGRGRSKQAIYECDCGGIVKKIVQSSAAELDELVLRR
jgi:hypothetical protein